MAPRNLDSQPPSGRASVPGGGRGPAGEGRTTGRARVPERGGGQDRRGRSAGPPTGGRGHPPTRGTPALVRTRRGPRWGRILLVVALGLGLVAGVGAGALALYARGLDDNMGRTEVFSEITGERPAEAASGALNILLLGSDSRDPDGTEGAYRADTIILMHVAEDQDDAYLISIPRDLWVPVPETEDGAGGGNAKINAATARGGVPLAVRTVEGYTGVRIDHVMIIDFAGFAEVTDALGGVDLMIEQTITSIHKPHRTFHEGLNHLTGEEALDYIRQRKQFPDGDFARMRHQQEFIKALLDKAASTGTLTNPAKLNAFLQTVTSTVTVDERFSMTGVGWQFRNLRADNLHFLTSPHLGSAQVDGQSVVLSDDELSASLYQAVRDDRVGEWITTNDPDDSGG